MVKDLGATAADDIVFSLVKAPQFADFVQIGTAKLEVEEYKDGDIKYGSTETKINQIQTETKPMEAELYYDIYYGKKTDNNKINFYEKIFTSEILDVLKKQKLENHSNFDVVKLDITLNSSKNENEKSFSRNFSRNISKNLSKYSLTFFSF